MSDELLSQILTEMKLINSEMLSIRSDIQSLKSDVTTSLERIEKKLDATFEQTASSAERINEVHDTVHQISTAQDRHERVLEVLSKRSIEQEAYISDIRFNNNV